MNITLVATMLGGLMLAAPDARIFLNGVAIDNLRGQQFNNATVRIDEAGRVHIDAPDYEVAPPAEKVHLKPYRLAPGEGVLVMFESMAHGQTGMTVQVIVNGKAILDKLDPMQVVHELLPNLKPGKNAVEIKLSRGDGKGAMTMNLVVGGLRGTNIEMTEQLASENVDLPRHGIKSFLLELTK